MSLFFHSVSSAGQLTVLLQKEKEYYSDSVYEAARDAQNKFVQASSIEGALKACDGLTSTSKLSYRLPTSEEHKKLIKAEKGLNIIEYVGPEGKKVLWELGAKIDEDSLKPVFDGYIEPQYLSYESYLWVKDDEFSGLSKLRWSSSSRLEEERIESYSNYIRSLFFGYSFLFFKGSFSPNDYRFFVDRLEMEKKKFVFASLGVSRAENLEEGEVKGEYGAPVYCVRAKEDILEGIAFLAIHSGENTPSIGIEEDKSGYASIQSERKRRASLADDDGSSLQVAEDIPFGQNIEVALGSAAIASKEDSEFLPSRKKIRTRRGGEKVLSDYITKSEDFEKRGLIFDLLQNTR